MAANRRICLQGNAISPEVVPLRVVNASDKAALIELAMPGSLSVVVAPGELENALRSKVRWK